MSLSNLCRVCVNICEDHKSLYDENGLGNELCAMLYKYFHPTVLDMEKWKDLTGICLKCWNYICDFDSFQQSVIKAQSKLIEDDDMVIVEAEVDDFDDLDNFEDFEGPSTSKQVPAYMYEIISPTEDALQNVNEGGLDQTELELTQRLANDECLPEKEDATQINTTAPEAVDRNSQYILDDELSLPQYIINVPEESATNESQATDYIDDLLAKWMPIIKCPICEEPHHNLPTYQAHFRQKHPSEQFYISCCELKLRQTFQIEKHLLFHKQLDELKCQKCGRSFSTTTYLENHVCLQLAERPISMKSCRVCGKDFASTMQLTKHFKASHTIQREFEGEIKTYYPCCYCQKIFGNARSFRQHLWYHERKEEEFKCPTCGLDGFRHRSTFNNHVATHTEQTQQT